MGATHPTFNDALKSLEFTKRPKNKENYTKAIGIYVEDLEENLESSPRTHNLGPSAERRRHTESSSGRAAALLPLGPAR
jgi:hypothetical protein